MYLYCLLGLCTCDAHYWQCAVMQESDTARVWTTCVTRISAPWPHMNEPCHTYESSHTYALYSLGKKSHVIYMSAPCYLKKRVPTKTHWYHQHWMKFSNVSATNFEYSKLSSELTFENFYLEVRVWGGWGGGLGVRALRGPLISVSPVFYYIVLYWILF